MKSLSVLTIILFLSSIFLHELNAEEIIVNPSVGENFVIDVKPHHYYLGVIEQIQGHLMDHPLTQAAKSLDFTEDQKISFSYSMQLPRSVAKKGKLTNPRKYHEPVTAGEKESIRYIIVSLAKYDWWQLLKEESSLNKAGDRINHVHPFRFLECVFTDEELKVGLFAIRNKSIIWGKYYDGLKQSLNEESALNNLTQFTQDFANNIGIHPDLILSYVQNHQWSALVDVLIDSIPRQGNPDRYDL